jgi:hypothetical protein
MQSAKCKMENLEGAMKRKDVFPVIAWRFALHLPFVVGGDKA